MKYSDHQTKFIGK